jgi:hypothetical protein
LKDEKAYEGREENLPRLNTQGDLFTFISNLDDFMKQDKEK